MEKYVTILYSVLATVVFVLSVYLGYLSNLNRKRRMQNSARAKDLHQRTIKYEQSIVESLRIISLAVIQQQCEVAEGCIRIKKLLDYLPNLERKPEYDLFEELYDKLKDFDYLQARERLSNQERYQQDKKRWVIESDYVDRMIQSCQVLFEHMTSIKSLE